MRLGVMGGTFDPIHHGHLVAASEVQSLLGLDEVVFVPTGEPWQKEGRDVAPAEHRYLMTVVATASNPRFTVSRVDIDREGPTYTIDTLRDLRAQRPDAELFFITGADALAQILSWKDSDELFGLAQFIGVTRPGYQLTESGLPAFLVRDSGLNSGLMMAHVTAAALVSEMKTLAHPAAADSIPTSAGREDHVSMSMWAAIKVARVVDLATGVLAIELLAACQAVDLLAPLTTSSALAAVHAAIRRDVPTIETDRTPAPDIERIAALITAGGIERACPEKIS